MGWSDPPPAVSRLRWVTWSILHPRKKRALDLLVDAVRQREYETDVIWNMERIYWEGVRCAICEKEFDVESWENRHTGSDPLTEVHAKCCEMLGPCSRPPSPGG